MDILFVHNNFPGQFPHLVERLVAQPKIRVFGIGGPPAKRQPGAELIRYALPPVTALLSHPFARKLESDAIRAEQVLYAGLELKRRGADPQLIVVHPGWGDALPLRELFPKSRIVSYCEFYYKTSGADCAFDPEFPEFGVDGRVKMRIRNASLLLSLTEADAGLSPTEWQRSVFPAELQNKISVIHDGVDTAKVRPDPQAILTTGEGHRFTAHDQVITFVARNLEPYRGYHVFMRALPEVLRALPEAHVILIGGNKVSYGAAPRGRLSWKQIFLNEVKDRIDTNRVHFLGRVPYETYLRALQISAAHVYLTYPFVLSWSAIEALATGCLVIGSDTPPVREVITEGNNGLLVPFFDYQVLSERIIEAVRNRARYKNIREHARTYAVSKFDLHNVCLPRQMEFLFSGLDQTAASAVPDIGRSASPRKMSADQGRRRA